MKLKTTITLILITLLMSVFAFSQSKKGYKLVWQDNFSSKNIDAKSWTHEVARSGWVNNEKQRYTDGENAVQKKGKLMLIARYENNEYTSKQEWAMPRWMCQFEAHDAQENAVRRGKYFDSGNPERQRF